MEWSRRICAALVAVTLLFPGAALAQDGCGSCPSDCPMHVKTAAPEPGCHRGKHGGEHHDAPPAAHPASAKPDCELRASCGMDLNVTLSLETRNVGPHVAMPTYPSSPAPAILVPTVVTPSAPAVPTRPPRSSRTA